MTSSLSNVMEKAKVYVRFLECEFKPNSTPKTSSRGESCPSHRSLADVGLGFFPIHPLTSNTSWAWCVDNNGEWSFGLILNML